MMYIPKRHVTRGNFLATCNATMTNTNPSKLQRGCYTQATCLATVHMKDLVEIGHLTKYHAFRVNRDQVVSLEYGSKSIQTTVILTKRPPKLYKLLKFCKFCGNCKIPSCTYYLKEATMKIAMFAHFKEQCPFSLHQRNDIKPLTGLECFGTSVVKSFWSK